MRGGRPAGALGRIGAAMPNYGVPQAGGQLTAPSPGSLFYLFNAESPAAPQASIAFARPASPVGGRDPITFSISFAAAPTASLVIEGSHVDSDSQYQTLYTSTNKQLDFYTDDGSWMFYRCKLVTQTGGGAVTVIVRL